MAAHPAVKYRRIYLRYRPSIFIAQQLHCATTRLHGKAAFIAKSMTAPKTSDRLAIPSGRPLQSLAPVVNHPFPKRVSDRRPTNVALSQSFHLGLENGSDGFAHSEHLSSAGLLFFSNWVYPTNIKSIPFIIGTV